MNIHTNRLFSPAIALSSSTFHIPDSLKIFKEGGSNALVVALAEQLKFKKITPESMNEIVPILFSERGRTTDFSFGGLLMWVDYFHYEYAIINSTLFIKGKVENDIMTTAFSMPVGILPLEMSVAILREYCGMHDLPLIFSAVPEYAVRDFRLLSPVSVDLLTNWSDYLYSAESLATLKGKKYGKKRNHVNQFLAAFPDYSFEPLTGDNASEAIKFMDLIDKEGDMNPMAIEERKLNRYMLEIVKEGNEYLLGGILRDGSGRMLGFTIGDIKGDTLFVHIEKALRDAPGAFEMINKSFAEYICSEHPEIEYINREDDSGDEGLRKAKESYHPVELLRKYNIKFDN